MSYLQECMSLGQWLGQDDRRALYKYLLKTNSESYTSQAREIFSTGFYSKKIANGEIKFLFKSGKISYCARRLDSDKFTDVIREAELIGPNFYKVSKIKKFFAQSDVEVICNYPLPGPNNQTEGSFTVNSYPFYDLAYYSDGKNRIIGFLKKLKIDDRQLINKLNTF